MPSKPFGILILAVIAAGILAFMASEVSGQGMSCAPIEPLVKSLVTGKYNERPLFEGITAGNRTPIHFFANARTGTWTLVIEPRPGLGCVLLAGEQFKPSKPLMESPL